MKPEIALVLVIILMILMFYFGRLYEKKSQTRTIYLIQNKEKEMFVDEKYNLTNHVLEVKIMVDKKEAKKVFEGLDKSRYAIIERWLD